MQQFKLNKHQGYYLAKWNSFSGDLKFRKWQLVMFKGVTYFISFGRNITARHKTLKCDL